jgi:PII-like signaling protein
MKSIEAVMVRVYLLDADTHLKTLVKRLNDWGKVRGLTVFRGIAGFGKSGTIHSSSLLNMSLDLPVVIEFFDEPKKANAMIEYLYSVVGPGHIVSWPAQIMVEDKETDNGE